jgi:hypothetical protein
MERSQFNTNINSVNNVSGKNLWRTLLILFIVEILIISGLTVFLIYSTGTGMGEGNSRAPTKLSLPDEVGSGKFNFVTLGDMNKDGYLDIIAGAGGYPGSEPGGLYVLLNQKGNSFTSASSGLPGKVKNYFGSVQVIDVNQDSNLDIIAAYESHWSGGDSKGIGIWLGNGGSGGSMVWSAAKSPVASGSYDSAFCADINGDDQLDLVGGSSKGLYAWLGSHTGSTLSWTSASEGLPVSNEFTGVTLGDINKDGRLDIVAGSYSSQGISVYLCSSTGAISWSEGDKDTNLKSSGNTFGNYLIDLNHDSNLDLVSSLRGGFKVYLGNGNSGARETWWKDVSKNLPTSGDYFAIDVKDINADDKLDICTDFQIWSNSGSMTNPDSYSWEKLDFGAKLDEPVGIAVGDLNNDDNLDIVGCGWGSGVVAYTLTLGSDPHGPSYHFIKGKITALKDGSPIIGASVTTDKGDYTTTTDNSGSYELNVTDDTYQLTVTFTDYKEAKKLAEVDGADVKLDFQLVELSDFPELEYKLSGVITDIESDEPLAGVSVYIEPGEQNAITDSQGKYTIMVSNGSYILTFSSSGYESDSTNIDVHGNSVIKDFTLASTTSNGDLDDKKKDDSGLPFLELPIIIFAIAIIVIIVRISNKKR